MRKFKSNVYCRNHPDPVYRNVTVTEEDFKRGWTWIVCLDCDGTGIFEVTDTHKLTCVPCKGQGKMRASI